MVWFDFFNDISTSMGYFGWLEKFGLVGFYGTSSILGYLMPNPVYKYILNIYDL